MNIIRKISIAALCYFICVASAQAKPDERGFQKQLIEVGAYGGALFMADSHELYDSENTTHKRLRDVGVNIGLRLGYMYKWYGAELEGGFSPNKAEGAGNATLFHLRAHMIVQLPKEIAPFFVIGGGLLGVSSDNADLGSDIDPAFHWGVGLKWHATPWLAVRVDARQTVTNRRRPGNLTNHFELLGGVSYVFGWKANDDWDNDTVLNAADQCPEVKGLVETSGCPPKDTDGDKVFDHLDKCPKQKAETPDGCPYKDSDGDGIIDPKDKCPKIKADTKDGCPHKDSDGDGIIDLKDRCPQKPAKTEDGCPPKDTDGDGFTDDVDKCISQPETKNGFKDDDGCPDTIPKAVKKFTGTIKGITFENNKDVIRPTSRPTLDAAIKLLKEYKSLKLRIRGHSDNRGKKAYNVDLSRRRAEAVKRYFTGNGVEASRLETEGVGPGEPIASNKTRKGRAQNRRIEFTLIK